MSQTNDGFDVDYEEGEDILNDAIPTDYNECVECGLSHEYQPAPAALWHKKHGSHIP